MVRDGFADGIQEQLDPALQIQQNTLSGQLETPFVYQNMPAASYIRLVSI
jgi:hypothetical protein